MQIQIEIHDEQKVDFILQLLHEFSFVNVLSPSNGATKTAPEKKKLTLEQQELADDIREGLDMVEMHLQGKIKLKTLKEVLAEL